VVKIGQITLYVDESTEELLKEKSDISYSKIFKNALKEHLTNAKDLNNELDKLPNGDELKDQFKNLPTPEHIEAINKELDETIGKLEEIKELKS